MRRYFAREPRYPRQELERQAQEAIDARVGMGRPPEEEFRPLEQRLAEADRAVAARPPVEPLPEPQPIQVRHVQMPPAPAPAERAEPALPKARKGRPLAARQSAN